MIILEHLKSLEHITYDMISTDLNDAEDGIIVDLTSFLSDYMDMLKIQRFLNRYRNEALTGDIILLLQHPPTYTTGIHDNPPEYPFLHEKPIKLERGGSVTYHGPGQVVMYFIISLKKRKMNVLDLIKMVQSSISLSLGEYAVASEGRLGKETGVWTSGGRKIASIGLAVNGFSTLHGAAVNINNDMGSFARIRPCGFDHEIMTNLSIEAGRDITVGEYTGPQIRNLTDIFRIDNVKKYEDMPGFRQYLSEQLSVTVPS